MIWFFSILCMAFPLLSSNVHFFGWFKYLRFERTFSMYFAPFPITCVEECIFCLYSVVLLTIIVPLKQAPPLSCAIQTIQSRHLKKTWEENRMTKIIRIKLKHINASSWPPQEMLLLKKENLSLVLNLLEKQKNKHEFNRIKRSFTSLVVPLWPAPRFCHKCMLFALKWSSVVVVGKSIPDKKMQ